jgi:hypothetical protein
MAIKNHNFGLKFCSNTNDPTENKKDQMKSEKLQMFKILLQKLIIKKQKRNKDQKLLKQRKTANNTEQCIKGT